MLEVEIVGEDNHIFVIRIETMLDVPQPGREITCGVCKKTVKIRTVGFPGKIRNDIPRQPGEDMF